MSSILALSVAVPALGGPSNPIATGAATAAQTAKKALKKAKKAQSAADAAQTTANAAQTAANAANTNANGRIKQINEITDAGSATSSDNKGDTAACPSGQEVTGGGYFTTGAGTNDVTPQFATAYSDAWITNLEEIGAGTADTWAVTTTALCAQK